MRTRFRVLILCISGFAFSVVQASAQSILTSSTQALNAGTQQWEKIATFSNTDGNGEVLTLHYYGGLGYNDTLAQQSNAEIQLRQSYPASCNTICVSGYFFEWGGGDQEIAAVQVVQTANYSYDIYAQINAYQGADQWVAYVSPGGTLTWDEVVATPPTGTNVLALSQIYNFQDGSLVVTNNKVGIGVTSPAYALQVSRSNSTTSSPATIGFSIGGSGNASRFDLDSASGMQVAYGDRSQLSSYWGMEIRGNQQQIGYPSFVAGGSNDASLSVYGTAGNGADILDIVNNSGSKLDVISSGGNVGIGTTGPAYKLDVEGGQINSSGGYCIGGTCISSWPTAGANTWSGAQTFSGTVNFPSGIWNSSGSVGIGTTTPLATLDVVPPITKFDTTANGYSVLSLRTDEASGFSSLGVGFLGAASQINRGFQFQTGEQGVLNGGNILFQPYGGNVGIGTTSPGARLEIDGNMKLTANSGASIIFQDGSIQTTAFTGVSCGGDFAESVDIQGTHNAYEPGDVLVLTSDGNGDVARSSGPYSTMVAGIYSTKPGYVGRRLSGPRGANEVPLAMVGIVPTKVSAENGSIRRGDLLVTASMTGYAMKGTDRSRMLGAVVGKAMGSLESGTGVIEVLVTLQ